MLKTVTVSQLLPLLLQQMFEDAQARRSALAKLYKDMNFVLLFEINFQKRSKLIKFSHFDLK